MKLALDEIAVALPDHLSPKTIERFNIAFRGLSYQSDYCLYHYEQFKAEHERHEAAMRGALPLDQIQNPQYYRIAFEANAYAFFRALHAMIESLPYLLNIILTVKEDVEARDVNWKTLTEWLAERPDFEAPRKQIKTLRGSSLYKQLNTLVNVTKHRRIPRIDSGTFAGSRPRFCPDDLDQEFESHNIIQLMEAAYDELHPQALEIILSIAGARQTAS